MNEERIQQVLEIEKQANAIRDAALHEASLLPVQAEKEAQALTDKARAEAEQKARQMVAEAQAEQERADIMNQAQEKVQRIESTAKSNMEKAVAFVLSRVVGRE